MYYMLAQHKTPPLRQKPSPLSFTHVVHVFHKCSLMFHSSCQPSAVAAESIDARPPPSLGDPTHRGDNNTVLAPKSATLLPGEGPCSVGGPSIPRGVCAAAARGVLLPSWMLVVGDTRTHDAASDSGGEVGGSTRWWRCRGGGGDLRVCVGGGWCVVVDVDVGWWLIQQTYTQCT